MSMGVPYFPGRVFVVFLCAQSYDNCSESGGTSSKQGRAVVLQCPCRRANAIGVLCPWAGPWPAPWPKDKASTWPRHDNMGMGTRPRPGPMHWGWAQGWVHGRDQRSDEGGTCRNLAELGGTWRNLAELGGIWRNLAELGGVHRCAPVRSGAIWRNLAVLTGAAGPGQFDLGFVRWWDPDLGSLRMSWEGGGGGREQGDRLRRLSVPDVQGRLLPGGVALLGKHHTHNSLYGLPFR